MRRKKLKFILKINIENFKKNHLSYQKKHHERTVLIIHGKIVFTQNQ